MAATRRRRRRRRRRPSAEERARAQIGAAYYRDRIRPAPTREPEPEGAPANVEFVAQLRAEAARRTRRPADEVT